MHTELVQSSCYAVGYIARQPDSWIQLLKIIGIVIVLGSIFWAVSIALLVELYFRIVPTLAIPSKVTKVLTALKLQGSHLRVIHFTKSVAMTAGFISPKVYLSNTAINQLTSKEIEAVLLHEYYHIENHHSRMHTLLFSVRGLQVFFPLLKELESYLRSRAEIAADDAAAASQGTGRYVIRALKKIDTGILFPIITGFMTAASSDHKKNSYDLKHLRKHTTIEMKQLLKAVAIGTFWVFVYSWQSAQPSVVLADTNPSVCSFRECLSACVSRELMSRNRLYSAATTD